MDAGVVEVCPECGAAVAGDDRFCEACGASLAGEAGTGAVAGAGGGGDGDPNGGRFALAQTTQESEIHLANHPPVSTTGPSPTAAPTPGQPCVGCGAPPDAIGADGYCTICGRRQPSPRDHHEVDCRWAAGVTDKGHRHPRNEDALFLQVTDDAAVAVVCDGVSTTSDPDLASQTAATTAGELLAKAILVRPDQLAEATTDAAAAAQTAVAQLGHSHGDDPENAPATTFVSATCHNGTITVGWIGDSRAYWLAPTNSEQLTVDDSWAEAQVEAGVLTTEVAEADPRAHGITRWLGAGAPEGPARVRTFTPATPGRLLVCSDGLWNYTTTIDELRALVDGQPPPTAPLEVARHLTNFALNAGGHDNITVVIVDLTEEPKGAP